MATEYTSLLGLALPKTGELSGTWGDTVNDYITRYVDAAVAGAQTISGSQTAVTLSTTNGSSLSQAGSGATGSAQYSIINCTGNPASLLTITVPATSKVYLVLNSTSTSQSVKVVGPGPTTGVTVATGKAALIAWNGSDFALVASTDASSLTGVLAVANGGTGLSSYTAGDLVYASGATTISKLAIGAANTVLTSSGTAPQWSSSLTGLTTVDTTNVEVTNIKAKDGTAAMSIADSTGVVSITANPILSGGTANGVVYLNGSKSATTGSALTFDGTTLGSTGLVVSTNRGQFKGNSSTGFTGGGVEIGYTGTVGIVNSYDRTASAYKDIQIYGNDIYNYVKGSNAIWDIAGTGEVMRLTSSGLEIKQSQLIGYSSYASIGTNGLAVAGNVGIGTSSPKIQEWRAGTYLTVANSSTRGQVEIDGAVADADSASLGALLFSYSTNTTNHKDVAIIEAVSSGTTANQRGGSLNFYTKANGTASPALNMTLNSSGNLGLGVTPSAWNSSFKAIQAGRSASFYGRDNATYDQAGLYSNAVFDATDSRWEYIIDNSGAGLPASGYLQSAGAHSWYTAPSGTVGNLISFTQALTLTANGALLVGDTSDISNGITNAAVSTKGQGTSGSRRATASEMGVTATLAQNDTANTYSFGGYGGYGLFVAEGSDPSTAWRAAAIVWSSGAALTILSLGSSNITVGSTGTTITVQNTSASSEAISWSMLVLG